MRWERIVCAFAVCAASLQPQSMVDVGSGAPTQVISQAFINAWARNGFNSLVGAPLGNVSKFGPANSTGYNQQFRGAANENATFALVKPDDTPTYNVLQVRAPMFAYYSSVGVANAGYPTVDTLTCPAAGSSTCQWQTFTNNYALFVYSATPFVASQSYTTREPFYSKWTALGGINGLGAATSAETAVASQYNSQATVQTFAGGALYNITSGTLSGRLLTVKGPIYDLYRSFNAHAGTLGLPVTEELAITGGKFRQTFEGGAIDYDPATRTAVLRPPISTLLLSPTGTVRLNLGQTLTATASVTLADGSPATDRSVAWNTTNGRVVQIQPNGLTAVLKAVGAGTAVITLSAEGKISLSLTITVYAPCCELGEGAPTASIQQAFRDAVARNKLSVQLPTASTVVRTAGGYTQQVLTTGTAPLPYLVAVPDGSVAGYVVGGAILAQYLSLGGPAGALGYPQSDATPGGRQIFQRGALAGNPVQVVSGAILAKWSDLGYETGALGLPTGASATFLTFRATAGSAQHFQNGLIMSPSTGPLAGQSFFIAGPVLAAYLSAGGASGDLGSPTNDEHPAGGLRQQDFEGGYINYAAGSESANVVRTERQPLVTAAPRSVVSGSVVHLAVGGFNNDATVRVSQTGQPDFLVKVPSGAYTWDAWVPRTATDGVVTVRAVDTNTNAAAQGSYTVRSPSAAGIAIAIVSGDLQEGAPGAQLAQPLVVAVTDLDGNVLADQSVTFAASPGAQVTPLQAITDGNGEARAFLRLPAAAGVALATAQAGIRVVTFSARASAFSLANFPALTQDVPGALGNGTDTIRQKGALLTSAAGIVRYLQSRNELGQANGLADPATLNTFLKSFCILDSQSNRICDGFISLESTAEQTVNLWRVGAFSGDEIEVRVVPPSLDAIRDLVAGGSPVLLALSLDGAGSHFVVATGLAANGSVRISDPNPAFGQTSLDAYLNGFTVGGSAVHGTLSGVVRLIPGAAKTTGFLLTSTQPVEISSASGACGQTLQFPSIAAVAGAALARRPGMLHFRFCEGSADTYQLDPAAPANNVFTSLTPNGGRVILDGTTSSLAVRSGSDWSLSPVAVSIRTAGVVNAATFGLDIAPGGLISIFGAGFARAGSEAAVEINGEPAAVIAALPFQVNAQVPPQIQPGSVLIKVTSPNGSAQQQASVREVAPAIFSINPAQAAITNQDNSLNAPSNPARRGETIVIYGTGFGAVIESGAVQAATAPVTAVIGGLEIPAAFAGLTPGAIGLYQANVTLPATLPPGLSLPLYLKQAGAVSNTVMLAVQ